MSKVTALEMYPNLLSEAWKTRETELGIVSYEVWELPETPVDSAIYTGCCAGTVKQAIEFMDKCVAESDHRYGMKVNLNDGSNVWMW